MKILAIDPSGNYVEGIGTTGYAIAHDDEITDVGELKADAFESAAEYWFAHKFMINAFKPDEVVCESYRLRKAKEQTHSLLETPQLIGVITVACYENEIPLTFQTPAQIKGRWSEDLMVEEGIIEKKGRSYYWKGKLLSPHMIDAIRHAIHYTRYTRKRTAG